jgi:ribulose-phosphate 3-epimerase
MIANPDQYIDDFVKAGADILTIHTEAVTHLHRSIQCIRDAGAKPAVSLNPATPLDTLEYVLEDLDMVLIMSVNPGFGGQAFIPSSIPKIRELRTRIKEKGLNVDIEVDGGISPKTIGSVSEAGANVFVAGSAIFGSGDYAETIRTMKERMVE